MSLSGIRRFIGRAIIASVVSVMACAPGAATAEVIVDMLYVKGANKVVVDRVNEWADALQLDFDNRSSGAGAAVGGSGSATIYAKAHPVDTTQTVEQLRKRWKDRAAIQVVYALGRDTQGAVTIEGTVFLGDFHGKLSGPSLPFKHRVSDTAFDDHRNFLLAVTYYAIGNNAVSKPAVACEFFRRAYSVSRPLPASVVSADALRTAVDSSLRASQCGTRRGGTQ